MTASFKPEDDGMILVSKFVAEMAHYQRKYRAKPFQDVFDEVLVSANQRLTDLGDPRRIQITETATEMIIELRDANTGDLSYSYAEDLAVAKRRE